MSASESSSPDPVRRMFSTIAGSYDLLNRLLSFGVDSNWRKKMVREVPAGGAAVLDLATGTADVALLLARTDDSGRLVVGTDFTMPMLRVGSGKVKRRQARRVVLAAGDGCRLPFPDDTFQAVTIAFGLRNIPSRACCLGEMARVLTPGGKALILEFSRIERPVLGPLFRLYFHRVLPLLGGLISGSPQAYRYLPESVDSFPDPVHLEGEMRDSGLVNVRHRPMTWGIACLHTGEKPRE